MYIFKCINVYDLSILKALADNTRLQLVLALLKKEHSVLELVALVKKSQPNISLALRKLEHAGLVASRKDGKRVIYRIAKRGVVEKILGQIKNE